MSTFIMAHNNMVGAVDVGNLIQEGLERDALYFDANNFNATRDILPKLLQIRNIIPLEVSYFLLFYVQPYVLDSSST